MKSMALKRSAICIALGACLASLTPLALAQSAMGAVAGRADVMGVFGAEPGPRTIFAASTFAGNPLSIAAGVATLQYAQEHRARLYPALDAVAARLQDGFAALAADFAVPAALQRAGSMPSRCMSCTSPVVARSSQPPSASMVRTTAAAGSGFNA